MSRRVLKVVAFSATVIFVGCGDQKAAIPTKLDQPLPTVVGSDGSGTPGPKKIEGVNKKGPPGTAVD